MQDLLIGLLQLHITVEQHRELDHLGSNEGRKCLIWQRGRFTDCIDLSQVKWSEENGKISTLKRCQILAKIVASKNARLSRHFEWSQPSVA